MSVGRCPAPACGRTISEGSGREPYAFEDLEFCDRECFRRWATLELQRLRGAADREQAYRAGLRSILLKTKPNTRGHALARKILATANGKRT